LFAAFFLALALWAAPASAQQNNILTNVSEAQIASLFPSGASYTPAVWEDSEIDQAGIDFPYRISAQSCQVIQGACYDSGGDIASAAYALGGGLYLYAYRVQSSFCDTVVLPNNEQYPVNCNLAAVHLTVPLGGNAPVADGPVTTGAFWVGTLDTLQQEDYHLYASVFAFFNPSDQWSEIDAYPITDPVTSATVDNAASPMGITFTFPGLNAATNSGNAALFGSPIENTGLPYAVTLETMFFGFISGVPPQVVTGQFASDFSGNLLPSFQMVAPTVVRMVDPDPDLLVANPSGTPAVVVTANANLLATGGQPVQGVAADGVAEVLLKIPAASAGQQFTLSLEGGQTGYANSNEDGGLADPLATGGGNTSFLQTLTVAAVTTSSGPMAFAVYQPPRDFPRASGVDDAYATRVEKVQLSTPAGGSSPGLPAAFSVTLVRPPVVFVHGLWGDPSDWGSFAPLNPTGPQGQDGRFFSSTVNYSLPLGSVSDTDTSPSYGSDEATVLSQATTSSLGFAFNAPFALDQIRGAVLTFRAGGNPLGAPVAAVQADVVGHSMGGLVARAATQVQGYSDPSNYDQGTIHKLITIGTPHLGTPLAGDLLDSANFCVADELAIRGNPAFSSVTLDIGTQYSTTADGGVWDLEGTGDGTSLSPALVNLNGGGVDVPTALVVGLVGAVNLSGLDCLACRAELLRKWCSGAPLAQDLTSANWPTVFAGQPSDAVVPEESQGDGLAPASIETGFIHSAGLTMLDFSPPDELGNGDSADTIANVVVQLLNSPVTGLQFNEIP
jgi:pimeloyl-ACP methyl ester carboxylesterase